MGQANGRKSIFITGAASGMGLETARLFAGKGWFVGGYDVDAAGLDLYDRLLSENDQVLLTWVLGTVEAPDWAAPLLPRIAGFAKDRLSRQTGG